MSKGLLRLNAGSRRETLPRSLSLLLVVLLAVLAGSLPAVAGESGARGKRAGGRLLVERVLLGGAGKDGVEIEVHYRLIDVESLPGHPSKATLIIDEESGQGVLLKHLQSLVSPVSEDEAATSPPGILTFWDDKGVFKPGRPVTVAVAGLVQKHLVPEANAEYRKSAPQETGSQADAGSQGNVSADASLEVFEAKLTGADALLQVRFRTKGVMELSPDARYTYVLDPETGQRFDVLRVPRLGLMAPKRLGTYEAGSYIVVRNPGGKIKRGDRITVVVEGLRQEDVIVE